MRKNAAALSLLNASREIVRARENLRADRAQGRNFAYSEAELDRNWKYYKSQGGTATTSDEVKLPEDPCMASAGKFRQQTQAAQIQYRECAATHERDIRISRLAKEVVQARQWLAAAEKVQEEKRRNPNVDTRNSGEWASLAKLDPAQMRAGLAQRFTEYRSAGGQETRIENVKEMPDPCLVERRDAPPPSPVRREAVVIPARK